MYVLYLVLLPLVAGVNRAPQFVPGGDMARFSLPENTLVGTPVYTLRGTDPESSDVYYSISGDHFSVNRNTGTVTLVKQLDRETQPVINVIISITDTPVGEGEPNIVSLGRSINVLDVNDNAPVFHDVPYAFSIKETTPVGSIVFKEISVTDADGGTNGDVQLSCFAEISPEACDTFSVREVRFSEGRFGGIVTLRRELDYEKASVYTLTVRAEDQARGNRPRFTTTANIVVDIGDVQDQPPAFLKGPYSKLVPENTRPGTFILDVRVQDRDTGNPRDLQLELLNDVGDFFRLVNRKTDVHGVMSADMVTSERPLDREDPQILSNGGLYIFQIKATELIGGEPIGDTAYSNVTIVVTDQDDQKPTFNQHNFIVNVPENIGNGVPLPGLNVIVSDQDGGENAAYTLSLEDPQGIFSIFPSQGTGRTPVIIKVADTSRLDYERVDARQFMLGIVVSQRDSPVQTATVTVNVVDSNDNSPTFDSEKYEVDVPESAQAQTLITMVTAVDADSGSSGTLKYALKGFGSEKFFVNEDTGGVYLSECGLEQCLDYELQKSYSLTYTAEDGGGRGASVNLLINVVDENDNRPQFDKKEYRRTIDEGVTAFNPPLFVQARDADGPSQGGGKVFYSIVSGNTQDGLFFVEPISGEIKLQRAATHPGTDTGRYRLMVRAIDGGKPPLHKDVAVIITVGSEDNQRPVFRTAPYVGYVKENDAPGDVVVTVNANDPDGVDDQLRYSIHSGAKDNFVIDHVLGQIKIASQANLDKDVRGSEYALVIQAVDAGSPPQTGSTTVRVQVEDINNKPPKFPQDDYIDYVSEREGIGQKLLQVKAKDPDTSASIQYSIVEPIVASDRTGVMLAPSSKYDYKNAFRMEADGSIVVNHVLDSKSASVITFTVQAEDVNAEVNEPQIGKTEVTIYIQSFSDDNPIFSSPWTPADPRVKVSLPEETVVLSTVYTLSAVDPISKLPIANFEKLPESDPNNFFTVNRNNGEVTLQKRIDYEKLSEKTLQLIVQARGLAGISQAKLLFNVTDMNDHSPAFQQHQYKVELLESWLYPQAFLRVSATDEDTEFGYGDVQYSLEGEGHEHFFIDSATGDITVAPGRELDREERDSYILTVTAQDTPKDGDPMQTSVPLEIDLLDVNDNPPRFLLTSPSSQSCQFTAVVPENAPEGFRVIRLTAQDVDDADNGNVELDIPDGGFLSNYFSINPDTESSRGGKFVGVVFVQSSLAGKGRADRYELQIRASDRGSPPKTTTAVLCILIGDVSKNDGVPVILAPKPDEVVAIPEDSPPGTVLYQVKASDPDNPRTDNGKLVYSFLGNDISIPFKIDPSSGGIVTSQDLDRENRDSYLLVLLVQDLGSPPQQASREFMVKVTDIDDHKPTFPKQLRVRPYEVSVSEEVDTGTVVATLSAQDEDQGENSLIEYHIIGGNDNLTFAVNSTEDNRAVIYTNGRVDREQKQEHLLILKCSPRGLEFSRFSKGVDLEDPSVMQIRVLVDDIDDNKPKFTKENLTLSVHVKLSPYMELARFEAVDPDSTGEMRYNLTSIEFHRLKAGDVRFPSLQSVFVLDPVTGVLQTGTDSFKQFADGYFHLKIQASSSNYSTANTEAKVFVLRDTDLLKFVFDSPPRVVRNQLDEFKSSVEEALNLPISLNLYGSQYYSKSDGRLDTTSTSSCFQLLDEQEVYSISDAKFVLDPKREEKLEAVYDQFQMRRLERCAEERDTYRMSWVELWVLGIAAFIALTAFIATLVLCAMHSMYMDRMKRRAYIQMHDGAPLAVPSVIGEWNDKPHSH